MKEIRCFNIPHTFPMEKPLNYRALKLTKLINKLVVKPKQMLRTLFIKNIIHHLLSDTVKCILTTAEIIYQQYWLFSHPYFLAS